MSIRPHTGFDSRLEFNRNILQADSVPKVRPDEHGAQVHGVSCRPNGFCAPYLLDLNPKSMDPWCLPHESSDALLYLDRTFAVPGKEIRIRAAEILKGHSLAMPAGDAMDVSALPKGIYFLPQSPTRKILVD